jgi:hypothetical protein
MSLHRKKVGIGLATTLGTFGLGVSGFTIPAVGFTIMAIGIPTGLAIAFWPDRWAPNWGARKRARELLRNTLPAFQQAVAGADNAWVHLVPIAPHFGPAMQKPLEVAIERAESGERRVVTEAINALSNAISDRHDPRPLIFPAYVAYREWRHQVMKLAELLGQQINLTRDYIVWSDAERRFLTGLWGALEDHSMEGERRAVLEYEQAHGRFLPVEEARKLIEGS